MASDSILKRVSSGRITRPQKVVLYGPEGIGKSTLAGKLPKPVFIDTEGGTHHLDVVRFPDITTWEEITAAVAQLATEDHDFKTLVIDTADWLEKRLAEHICRKANKESIEDFGYGKGYVILAEEFSKFLASLDGLLKRGMHIVFLAHSTVRKFESPDQAGGYDRFELKLSKQVAPLLKEWTDLILFGNYVTKLAENESGKKRGVGGRERTLFTTHTAAWDAKNRHGLEEKLPFTLDAIASVFGGDVKAATSTPTPATPEKSQEERLTELFGDRLDTALAFLVSRGQITNQGSLADVKAEYAARIFAAPAKFMEALDAFEKGAAK